jgi:hypothetical protein
MALGNEPGGMKTASYCKVLVVTGIASAGLILSLFIVLMLYSHWQSATSAASTSIPPAVQPLLADAKSKLLDMTRQMPEVKSFMQKYPEAASEVADIEYSYTSPESVMDLNIKNFTVDSAEVKYSYQRNNAEAYQMNSSMYIYIQKRQATEISTSVGIFPVKPFGGYYYSVQPECILSKLGSYTKTIPGFPDGTYTAYLSKDCSEIKGLQ